MRLMTTHAASARNATAGARRPDVLVVGCRQLSRGDIATRDHNQREGVKANAGPVLDQEEDGAVQSVQHHAQEKRPLVPVDGPLPEKDRKSTRLNSSHLGISY